MQRRNQLHALLAAYGTLSDLDLAFLDRVSVANDAQLPPLEEIATAEAYHYSPRLLGRLMRRVISAYVWPHSAFFHKSDCFEPLVRCAALLSEFQHADGTFDQGNLHSPPDSSFTIQDLCIGYRLLAIDGSETMRPVWEQLALIIRKAAPALVRGGVHTPNHRWEICASLARIDQLWPDPVYADRIDAWLSEGIDSDSDGLYSERSPNYASAVSNPALLTLALVAGRSALLGYVRHNLEASLYLLEPNGEVEAVQSRRQDQTKAFEGLRYLLQFRALALLDQDGRFAQIVDDLLDRSAQAHDELLGDLLAELIDRPFLAQPLPQRSEPPRHFSQHFRESKLVRIRRDQLSATIFGGTDFAQIDQIASGLATNPTFFKLRSGAAILDSLRLMPAFFGIGHFRSAGLEARDGRFYLQQTMSAAYYQPLSAPHLRHNGDYPLSNDGRFYAKMDFPQRQRDECRLAIAVEIEPLADGFDLTFDLSESAVSFALELCFRAGGELEGEQLRALPDGSFHLLEGMASYRVGADTIRFGPGLSNTPVVIEHGERYTHLNGNLTPEGLRVYLTGRSPLRYRFQIRA
jgi:hypothetical protein